MNKLSIDQLRADVARHFTDYQIGSMSSAQFDTLIDFMIAALIGIDVYELMSARHSTYKYHVYFF